MSLIQTSIIRAFARLLALGALTGAAVLLLIASITVPVITTKACPRRGISR